MRVTAIMDRFAAHGGVGIQQRLVVRIVLHHQQGIEQRTGADTLLNLGEAEAILLNQLDLLRLMIGELRQ